MKVSYYERAYLEINRIIIQQDVIRKHIIDREFVEKYNHNINVELEERPGYENEIYVRALRNLLEIIKNNTKQIDLQLKEEEDIYIDSDEGYLFKRVTITKAIKRLNWFVAKYSDYLEATSK